MKLRRYSVTLFVAVLLVAVMAGCPSTTQRQQAATAAREASAVMSGFESAEIVAHQQGLIPDADHQLIQGYVLSVAQTGKTTDACILSTTTNAGIVTCVQTAIGTINTLNGEGALHLKSAQAKNDFALAMTGTQAALQVIVTIMGGK